MSGLVQIIFGVILVIGGGSLHLSGAKIAPDGLEWLVPGAGLTGATYIVTGLLSMAGGAIGKAFTRDDGPDPKALKRQLDKFHELMAGAAVRMVGADGQIGKAEMAMVSGILEKHGQTKIPEGTIASIAQAAHANPDKYVELIVSEGGVLSVEQKEHILRACLLVAMADVVIDPAELDYLKKVADALNLEEARINAIRDELTAVAQKLVGAASFAA